MVFDEQVTARNERLLDVGESIQTSIEADRDHLVSILWKRERRNVGLYPVRPISDAPIRRVFTGDFYAFGTDSRDV